MSSKSYSNFSNKCKFSRVRSNTFTHESNGAFVDLVSNGLKLWNCALRSISRNSTLLHAIQLIRGNGSRNTIETRSANDSRQSFSSEHITRTRRWVSPTVEREPPSGQYIHQWRRNFIGTGTVQDRTRSVRPRSSAEKLNLVKYFSVQKLSQAYIIPKLNCK